MTVFDLLRRIIDGTELNPRSRIAELQRRKVAIDAEIAQINQGRLDIMEPTHIRERFLQMASTARELLSDFGAVDTTSAAWTARLKAKRQIEQITPLIAEK